MTVPNQLEEIGAKHRDFDPPRALQLALDAVRETCLVQFGEEFAQTEDSPVLEHADFGSSITLANEDGGMIMAIMADDASAHALTRLLFALEEDEEIPDEDLADALNEIINVAAGVLKGYLGDGSNLNLGLPLFLEGNKSLKYISAGICGQGLQMRHTDGNSIQVYLIWQEGTK